MAKKSNEGNILQRLIRTLGLIILAVILTYLGIETDIIDDLMESTSETTTDSGSTTADGQSQGNIVVPPSGGSGDWYSIYFTRPINSNDEEDHHGAEIEQALIAEIDKAQNTIDAALFELNAPDTTEALKRALDRGVQVRIVADDEHNYEDPESTLEELIDAGAEARSDERSALMHNKFLIFDGDVLWMGSMNVTRNGMYNNNNNGVIIQDAQLARNYQNEFDEMFLDGVFNRRDDSRPIASRNLTINDTLVETYFAPESGDEVVARIVELVDGAQSSVRVMAFSFTLDDIGNAMIAAMDRGVTVEGVVETTGSLRGQLTPLVCAGADMKQDGNPNILHHKVFIIDEQIVVTGSLNFSNNARDNNNENVLIIHNSAIASLYTQEWQARFAEGRIPPAEDIDC